MADFGLSEDVYSRNYFKQGQAGTEGTAVKLPVKWMGLESLLDGLFTEKTDVVRITLQGACFELWGGHSVQTVNYTHCLSHMVWLQLRRA